MYDSAYLNGMSEETPVNPSSKKGKVRAEIAAMIMKQVEEAKLIALIVRSADFYGPGIKNNSMLTETVFKPLSNKKAANWMASLNFNSDKFNKHFDFRATPYIQGIKEIIKLDYTK